MQLGQQPEPTQLTLLDADRDCAICGRELSTQEVELCESCMLQEGEFLVLANENA